MVEKPEVRKFSKWLLAGMAIWGMASVPVSAAELQPGFIINKGNVDKVMDDTFQGKTIRSMLLPSQVYQIKEWALEMKIRNTYLHPQSKGFKEATKRYQKDVKFDPVTREVTGYKAGMPFVIDPADKYAGDKVIWNYYYAHQGGRTQHVPHSWLLVHADKGVERRQDWFWLRLYMKGRLENGGNNPVLDEGLVSKTLFFVTAPYDLRGIGLFTLRYDSPQLEDNWVYVKSVRRTRKLSGGAWTDPVDGLDMLNDEIWLINARPSWYKSWKLLGKKTIFVVANSKMNWVKGAKTLEEEFPIVDLKNFPHWNPSPATNEWEPREVWEVEGIPPDYHPHSRKMIYAHASPDDPTVYIAEGYDKENKLWKYVQYMLGPLDKTNAKDHREGNVIPYKNDDEAMALAITPMGMYVDFKRRHASHHYCRLWDLSATFGPNEVTLGGLEAAGK